MGGAPGTEELDRGPYESNVFQPESKLASYIPGGYSPSRCMKLSGMPMVYAIYAYAGCAIMFFGYDTAVMSQVNINPDYLQTMGVAGGTDRDAAAIGGLVSLWFGGFAIAGAMMVGYTADRVGRLKTIQIGCIWGILGAVLLATAQNISWFACARVISGIGCGYLNTIVPVWTSELAPANMRGAFVAVQFTLAMVGSALVYWLEYACVKTRSLSFAWRFPNAFQVIFLLVLLVFGPFYPESPRYLAKIGKIDHAKSILQKCRTDPNEGKIDNEMEEILDAIRLEASGSNPSFYNMLFTSDKLHTRRRVFLGAGVQIMQKFTGIDFIAVYAPNIFAFSGFKGDTPALLAGGNWFGYILALALSIYLCDHVGRRKMMLSGCTLMGIVLIIGGILSQQTLKYAELDPGKANRFGAGVAAILYVYTFIYGSTWLTTCWVYPTEVFPLATRSKGTALATFAFSVAGGTINMIIPYLISAIGFWVFILFALINLVMLVPIYLFYIETANRHLEDLDLLFASKSSFVWRAEKEFANVKGSQRDNHGAIN
ncbi:Low-affinity glucose transporter HXT3 [Trichophyton interdigitale]|uniref:Low-affinity glucose transporter HXT3 n=1 Tax=Trichophyton interdigitale TaxID=101480 RepID=A0A9P4YGR1_9EURO|nr:Low-affinity glucose transporter HXT3 [Trichophyton interdigitale]KAF3896057.1 Low-affinity glucose transporter HXT3 [Trichophyton interdigitale]KAG8211079.1 Low-affinity glucose transporter HXT3 [Trichophyton interdigitale]